MKLETIAKILLGIFILFIIGGCVFIYYLYKNETRIVNVSIPYQEPGNKTLYSGTLTYKIRGYEFPPYTYKFNDATSIKRENTYWGYNVIICYDSKCDPHPATEGYDEIQEYPSKIVENKTKNRNEQKEVTKTNWEWLWNEINGNIS